MEYNKEIFKKLIEENSTLSNVDLAKLYNHTERTSYEIENLRKAFSAYKLKNLIDEALDEKGFEEETKVNNEKGTLESKIECDFKPKDDIELARLHKIDLTKYKISSYWSKLKSNGKFTSSIFCTLRKLGDSITLDEVKEAITESIFSTKKLPVYNIPKVLPKSDKALIIWVSDEHVGASVQNELYNNKWDKSEYFTRKSKLIDIVKEQGSLHGNFDKLVVCTLGDTLDGFNSQTTRGGHTLQQNMTNKEAIKTYVEVNKCVWDGIVELGKTDTYELYNIENSNHGGLGWDAAANLGLTMYLQTKYPEFSITAIEKLIGSFSYGIHDIHLCHGKDEIHMKRNLPLHIDPKVENYIKEYLDENEYKEKDRPQHFVKGDLHQFATQQGRFFTYTNIPSLFGASGWVMSNIGKGKAGFCYSVISKNDTDFNFTPVWF